MGRDPQRIDQGIPETERLLAELCEIARRILETDANGLLRIEAELRKVRVERAVEKHCH